MLRVIWFKGYDDDTVIEANRLFYVASCPKLPYKKLHSLVASAASMDDDNRPNPINMNSLKS